MLCIWQNRDAAFRNMEVPMDRLEAMSGRSYIAASKRILNDVAEAERAASGEYTTPRGDLVVSAPLALGRMHLLPVVAAFLATFPEVDVQLSCRIEPSIFWKSTSMSPFGLARLPIAA